MLSHVRSAICSPAHGRTAAQTSRNMYSISRQRLRRLSQLVAPGGNCFRGVDQSLNKKAYQKLAMEPGAGTGRIFLGKVPQAHNGLHSFERQLDLPAGAV